MKALKKYEKSRNVQINLPTHKTYVYLGFEKLKKHN